MRVVARIIEAMGRMPEGATPIDDTVASRPYPHETLESPTPYDKRDKPGGMVKNVAGLRMPILTRTTVSLLSTGILIAAPSVARATPLIRGTQYFSWTGCHYDAPFGNKSSCVTMSGEFAWDSTGKGVSWLSGPECIVTAYNTFQVSFPNPPYQGYYYSNYGQNINYWCNYNQTDILGNVSRYGGRVTGDYTGQWSGRVV